ncbi:MAG: hypothetical protein MZU97_03180 [Bacillus subtilis]|nr:hypothetical protein [Bacillus subtilis]
MTELVRRKGPSTLCTPSKGGALPNRLRPVPVMPVTSAHRVMLNPPEIPLFQKMWFEGKKLLLLPDKSW